jgi:LacI family transcriptional regulator
MASALTIKDLAKACGVSRQAVSYALRGDGRLADETRQRIQAIAQELGYRPNTIARTMRTGRFGSIALLTGTEPRYHRFPRGLWESIHDELAAHDQQLVMTRIPENRLSMPDYLPKVFREWSVDGVLVNYTHNISGIFAEAITAHRIPAVWLNTRVAKRCVAPADFDAGRIATEHLLQAGHRKISYFDVSYETGHHSEADRRNGYTAAMRAAGLAPRFLNPRQPPTGSSPNDRLALARAVLSQPDRPSGVVTYSSWAGEPMLVAALAMGLSVPRDIAIVTVEDYPVESIGVAITTVVLDVHEMGRVAVDMLLNSIQKPAEGKSEQMVLIAPKLVRGATS